ncbi:hypothetical protein TNIN_406361 [Trichonephila inaurata madagascariensis]|uniref:Uncharacterized protein n=1 Tax=Trichonephila inaurata madagascariensis TaxID=2747483 RepID=A0A8X6WS21_9ARAC|nr:hypothetical protein TNIN_406361 [Trichonephila inaurata madagascariensis]
MDDIDSKVMEKPEYLSRNSQDTEILSTCIEKTIPTQFPKSEELGGNGEFISFENQKSPEISNTEKDSKKTSSKDNLHFDQVSDNQFASKMDDIDSKVMEKPEYLSRNSQDTEILSTCIEKKIFQNSPLKFLKKWRKTPDQIQYPGVLEKSKCKENLDKNLSGTSTANDNSLSNIEEKNEDKSHVDEPVSITKSGIQLKEISPPEKVDISANRKRSRKSKKHKYSKLEPANGESNLKDLITSDCSVPGTSIIQETLNIKEIPECSVSSESHDSNEKVEDDSSISEINSKLGSISSISEMKHPSDLELNADQDTSENTNILQPTSVAPKLDSESTELSRPEKSGDLNTSKKKKKKGKQKSDISKQVSEDFKQKEIIIPQEISKVSNISPEKGKLNESDVSELSEKQLGDTLRKNIKGLMSSTCLEDKNSVEESNMKEAFVSRNVSDNGNFVVGPNSDIKELKVEKNLNDKEWIKNNHFGESVQIDGASKSKETKSLNETVVSDSHNQETIIDNKNVSKYHISVGRDIQRIETNIYL